MARLFLIIDGYNLMHAMGLVRRSGGPGDLERSRNRLIRQLATSLDPAIASDSVIVFDATDAGSQDPRTVAAAPIQVVYSQNGRDADTEIELMLSSHSSPKQVLVISSDHRLHKAARRRRARCMDSEAFCSQLEDSVHPVGHRPPGDSLRSAGAGKKAASPDRGMWRNAADLPSSTPEAGADFADEFLKIDVDAIKREVRKERP